MKISRFTPALWGVLIFTFCQALALCLIPREKAFIEATQVSPPEVTTGFALAYFAGTVVLLGVLLLLLPVSILKIVIRALFGLLYVWGILVFISLSFPTLSLLAVIIAVAVSLVRFIWPKVWLHNLLMAVSTVSAGAVFGFVFSPWAVILLLAVISVYDVLAVRFGYMQWMVKRMSDVAIPPAFIMPRGIAGWNWDLRGSAITELLSEAPSEREFSILGGGDVALPLTLVVSVALTYGFIESVITAAFSVLGVIGAYGIQIFLLKGRPLPALPPIASASFIGFLVVLALT